MSALVALAMVVWLVPVRGRGPRVHYVLRTPSLGHDPESASLCGLEGPADRYGRSKWRRVHAVGSEGICNECQSRSCERPTRVDWS